MFQKWTNAAHIFDTLANRVPPVLQMEQRLQIHFVIFIIWAVAHIDERVNAEMIPDWKFLRFDSSTLSQVLPEFFAMIHCFCIFRISEFGLRRLHHKSSRDQVTAYEFVRQRRVERGLFGQPVPRDHQRTTRHKQILQIFRIFTCIQECKHTNI